MIPARHTTIVLYRARYQPALQISIRLPHFDPKNGSCTVLRYRSCTVRLEIGVTPNT